MSSQSSVNSTTAPRTFSQFLRQDIRENKALSITMVALAAILVGLGVTGIVDPFVDPSWRDFGEAVGIPFVVFGAFFIAAPTLCVHVRYREELEAKRLKAERIESAGDLPSEIPADQPNQMLNKCPSGAVPTPHIEEESREKQKADRIKKVVGFFPIICPDELSRLLNECPPDVFNWILGDGERRSSARNPYPVLKIFLQEKTRSRFPQSVSGMVDCHKTVLNGEYRIKWVTPQQPES